MLLVHTTPERFRFYYQHYLNSLFAKNVYCSDRCNNFFVAKRCDFCCHVVANEPLSRRFSEVADEVSRYPFDDGQQTDNKKPRIINLNMDIKKYSYISVFNYNDHLTYRYSLMRCRTTGNSANRHFMP